MRNTSRRQFLSVLGGVGAAAALDTRLIVAESKPQAFDFLFITDTHLQPELNAASGCDMAFKKARTHKVDFAIQGGDHVFDTMHQTQERSDALFDLYRKTEQDLGMKLYHTCGNHDCFGISSKGKTPESDPLYGKKMFEEHFEKASYSFDHKGTHFMVLDSVQPLAGGTGYEGRIDDAQLEWIQSDLSKLPARQPIVVTTHIPLVTAVDCYGKMPADHHTGRGGSSIANADAVIKIFDQFNVIGVLQGHTHIWETVTWHGVPYITGGAVSGNWWKGTHMGTPEGYTMIRVEDGKLTARYETYGFHAVEPQQNT